MRFSKDFFLLKNTIYIKQFNLFKKFQSEYTVYLEDTHI